MTRVGDFLVKDDFVRAMTIMGVMAGSLEPYQEKKI